MVNKETVFDTNGCDEKLHAKKYSAAELFSFPETGYVRYSSKVLDNTYQYQERPWEPRLDIFIWPLKTIKLPVNFSDDSSPIQDLQLHMFCYEVHMLYSEVRHKQRENIIYLRTSILLAHHAERDAEKIMRDLPIRIVKDFQRILLYAQQNYDAGSPAYYEFCELTFRDVLIEIKNEVHLWKPASL